MSNIFQRTTEYYFQMPKRVVAEGIDLKLRPSSMVLYHRVLYRAQEMSSPLVLFKTPSLLEMIGVERGNLHIARAQLEEYNLVRSTKVGRGLWMFELLTRHGVGLDNSFIDLGKLSTDEVRSFYLPQLNDYNFVITTDGNLIARCPFCHNLKVRERPFHLKLEDDGDGIGVWQCFACEKAGRMIQFEMLRTRVDKGTAHNQVLDFFMRQREGDPKAPLHPTLPQPSGIGHDYVGMVDDYDEPTPI